MVCTNENVRVVGICTNFEDSTKRFSEISHTSFASRCRGVNQLSRKEEPVRLTAGLNGVENSGNNKIK